MVKREAMGEGGDLAGMFGGEGGEDLGELMAQALGGEGMEKLGEMMVQAMGEAFKEMGEGGDVDWGGEEGEGYDESAPLPPGADSKKCPACGTEAGEDETECSDCGEELD